MIIIQKLKPLNHIESYQITVYGMSFWTFNKSIFTCKEKVKAYLGYLEKAALLKLSSQCPIRQGRTWRTQLRKFIVLIQKLENVTDEKKVQEK